MTRTRTHATLLGATLIGVVALAAQPAGQRTSDLEAIEARLRALETRVAILERRVREPKRGRPVITGDLEGLPRVVIDAIAWAHPRTDVTDTDLEDGVWTIELDDPPNEWTMRVTISGRIIEDRVSD